MNLTLNWLKKHVDFNWSPEELTRLLATLGLPVFAKQRMLSA